MNPSRTGFVSAAAILLCIWKVHVSSFVQPTVTPRLNRGLGRGNTMSADNTSSTGRPTAVDKGDPPPIVWTIAGSDSGGGAGIQADLHAIHALGGHACSVITAMTAQNSQAVTHVEYASVEMIRATIDALKTDLPPSAVKLGMMGTDEVVSVVGDFLDDYTGNVVCDPVMISTSGSRLMKEGAEAKMRERIFPRATLITPNLMEAEVLLGRSLRRPQDVENGAADLLRSSGAGGVLIKGGHSTDTREDQDEASPNDHSGSAGFSQDYWTNGNPSESFWLTTPRIDSKNTHGTGCTLSSAAAACLARGLDPTDAVVISKAYVTEGIRAAHQLGQGPGPVAQAGWPTRADCFPWVTATSGGGAKERSEAFPRCHDDWGLYPIVDTSEWVEKLLSLGVRDIQLRIKGASADVRDAEVKRAAQACRAADGRLWVNDFWQVAVKHDAYGVHLGQEDLEAGGGEAIRAICSAGLRLGISTHSYLELARATAVRPSYIALGPVFETSSKKVSFSPRGAALVETWRALVDVPLVAIGGITLDTAPEVLEAGADSIAVISAVTKAEDVDEAIKQWSALFESRGR